jgi:hypothetical protein
MRATVLLALAAFPAFVCGQTFFELSNGQKCEGKVAGLAGNPRLDTAIGRLALAPDVRVMRRSPFEAHETVALAQYSLADDNAAGQLAVAELAASQGVWSAARRHLNLALAADPDSERALALASKWAKRFHLNAFEEGPKPNVRKALESWLEEDATRDWTGAAMVLAKAQGLGADLLLHPALKALRRDETHARWFAARALKDLRSSPERIKPLYRRSILDPSPVVRTECVRSLKVTEDPVFCRLFAKSLASSNQAVRIAAAEALAELELPQGAEPIVRLLAGETPVAPRNHIISVTQVSYVKDYDVEVAQNAVIADPVVDVAMDGMVLDVAVVSIQAERKVYFSALRRMTKQDFGADVGKWRSYLKTKDPETASR